MTTEKIEKGYGAGVVNRLTLDLKPEFPDMGLAPRNLWNKKRFFERYVQAKSKLQRSVAVLLWGQNMLLLEKQIAEEADLNKKITKNLAKIILTPNM